ncbi:MAG: winged helix-turn-helix domain-containing protein [Pseudomonadota bacterium]
MMGSDLHTWKDVTTFRLDEMRVDVLRGTISAGDVVVALEPKVMALFQALLEAPGEVRSRKALIDAVWRCDHGSDESLTRAVSILRRSFRKLDCRRVAIETFPKRGYQLVLDGVRPVPDVALSANRSATPPHHTIPAGPDRTLEEGADARRESAPRAKPLMMALGIVAVMAVAASGFRVGGPSSDEPPRDASADARLSETIEKNAFQVSEFESLDMTDRTERFAKTLRHGLASYLLDSRLQVRLDKAPSAKTDTEFVIEGTVATDSVEVRVVHTATRDILWSSPFRRSGSDDTAFGDRIASTTSNVMQCFAASRSLDYDSSPRVLALYARHCEMSVKGDSVKLQRNMEEIFRAEPDNPKAMALYANTLMRESLRGDFMTPQERRSMKREAEALFEKLDADGFSDTFKTLTSARHNDWAQDLAEAENSLRAAHIAEAIPGRAAVSYANFLRRVGRIREAAALYKALSIARPSDVRMITRYGWMMSVLGDETEGEAAYSRASKLNADWQELHARRSQSLTYWGDPEVALEALDNLRGAASKSAESIACTRAFLMHKISKQPTGDDFQAACHWQIGDSPWWVARMHVGLGELDKAFEVMRDEDWSHPGSTIILFYKDMHMVWQDPRFWDFAERQGLNPYWRSQNAWPDFCSDPRYAVDCPSLSEAAMKRALRDADNPLQR